MGTSSEQSLVRRAQLAVVAHIRHMHTNYDQLLKVVPWAEARRRVERHTLDRLVSWRGDDDGDANVMEDVLREVIVISDDEVEEEDEALGKHNNMISRKASRRNPSVESVFNEDLQTRPLNFATDEYFESEDETSVQYLGLAQPSSRHHQPYNQHKEDRLGAHRHRRWEEALDRRRKDPGLLNAHDHFDSSLGAKDRLGDASFQGQAQQRDRDPYKPDNLRQDLRPANHVASQKLTYTRLVQLPDSDLRLQSMADLGGDGSNLRSEQHDSRQQVSGLADELTIFSACSRTHWYMNSVLKMTNSPQIIQPSQQYRDFPTQRPGEPSQAYGAQDTAPRPAYHHEWQNRPLPIAAHNDSARFVEFQKSPLELNDSCYPPNSETLPRRHSDRVLPSIEDDAYAVRSQQDGSTTGPTRKSARSIVRINGHEEPPSSKRPRVDDFMHVSNQRTQEPYASYGHGRTILIPLDQVTNGPAPRQRPSRLTNDAEPRAIKHDPRIVMLSPRDPERYPDSGTEPQSIVQPGRGPNRPPLVVDYGRRGTLPPKHLQFSSSRAERGELSQVSLHDSQALRSSNSSSHYSLDASRLPTAYEMTDPHFLPRDDGATAVNGRDVNPRAADQNLSRFDEAGRGAHSRFRELALDPASRQSYAMDVDEDFTTKRLVQNNPQATSLDTYSYARPERHAYPAEPNQRGLRPIAHNSNNYRHLPEQPQKTSIRGEHDTYSAQNIQQQADMDSRNPFDRDLVLDMTRPTFYSRLQDVDVSYKKYQG